MSVKWFLSTLCKHIKAISDCGSSSLTIWLYSSSVSGSLTGFTGILLLVPPQTEGIFEEEQLIDSVSMHPFARGSQGKSGGRQGADWKTKHDSAKERYGTVEGMEVWGWRVGKHWRLLSLHPCTHPSIFLNPHPQVNTYICCTSAYYCVAELPLCTWCACSLLQSSRLHRYWLIWSMRRHVSMPHTRRHAQIFLLWWEALFNIFLNKFTKAVFFDLYIFWVCPCFFGLC